MRAIVRAIAGVVITAVTFPMLAHADSDRYEKKYGNMNLDIMNIHIHR